MRIFEGCFVALLLLATQQARAQEDRELPDFERVEREDLERLKPSRLKSDEAIGMLTTLALIPALSLLVLLLLKWWFFSPDIDTNNYRSTVKRAKNKGQGADIDPYRGIGNDPL